MYSVEPLQANNRLIGSKRKSTIGVMVHRNTRWLIYWKLNVPYLDRFSR